MGRSAVNVMAMLKHFRREVHPSRKFSEARMSMDFGMDIIISRCLGKNTYLLQDDECTDVAIPRWAALALARAAVREMERDV